MLIHRQEDPQAAEAARAAVLADDRLSYAAQGLLLGILEHAPEWSVNADSLSKMAKAVRGQNGETIGAVRAIFRELRAAGYMTQRVLMTGRRGTQLEVSDTPKRIEPAEVDLYPIPIPEPKHPIDRKGSVVYLIGSRSSTLVKIGTTRDVKKRLKGLQTSSPAPLEVLWTHSGDYELEDKLHERYQRRRVQGEWFDFGTSDPVALVSKYVRRLDNEHYEECERQLKEHGRILEWPDRY